ncbi:TPA: fimbrial protein [Vibrio diabolicus]
MYLKYIPLLALTLSLNAVAKIAEGELLVKGVVKNPTCSVEAPPEEVALGSYTPGDLILNKSKVVDLDITVDCSGSYSNGEFRGIYVNLNPLPSSPAVGSSMPGTMKTNLEGVGVKLSWDYNFNTLRFGDDVNPFSNNTGLFYINIRSQLVALSNYSESTIERGAAKAGMIVSLSYF